MPSEKCWCEAGDRLVEVAGQRGAVETMRLPAQRIGRVEVLHRRRVVAQIVERLAEREMHDHARK
jgi:hypothetical protein